MIIQKTTYASVTPISRRTMEPLEQSEPIDYGTLDYYVWVVIIILKVVLFNKTFAVALIKHPLLIHLHLVIIQLTSRACSCTYPNTLMINYTLSIYPLSINIMIRIQPEGVCRSSTIVFLYSHKSNISS